MKDIRCECGQFLGRFDGKYDVRCHKCKKVTKGDTRKAALENFRPKTWPKKLLFR